MAPSSLRKTIEAYCTAQDISIPPGFHRHSAYHYAIIQHDQQPAKLIAKTWAKQADIVYYVNHILIPEIGENLDGIEILDFKEGTRLRPSGTSRLESIGSFDLASPPQI